MGIAAFIALVIGALLVGVIGQVVVRPGTRSEWLVVGIAALAGGYMASEMVVGSTLFDFIKDWGPEIDGLVLIPAVIGGLLLALVADLGANTQPFVTT